MYETETQKQSFTTELFNGTRRSHSRVQVFQENSVYKPSQTTARCGNYNRKPVEFLLTHGLDINSHNNVQYIFDRDAKQTTCPRKMALVYCSWDYE